MLGIQVFFIIVLLYSLAMFILSSTIKMELKTKNIVNKSLMKICKELVIVFVIERDPRDAYNVLQLIIKIFKN